MNSLSARRISFQINSKITNFKRNLSGRIVYEYAPNYCSSYGPAYDHSIVRLHTKAFSGWRMKIKKFPVTMRTTDLTNLTLLNLFCIAGCSGWKRTSRRSWTTWSQGEASGKARNNGVKLRKMRLYNTVFRIVSYCNFMNALEPYEENSKDYMVWINNAIFFTGCCWSTWNERPKRRRWRWSIH
jgi:hypothetical protein